jgi:predicted RNA-binding Zn-ribbon protein involved in translation (DUF1610 family)
MGNSKIIGRTPCPECDYEGAHVKRSDKCVYRYCPECGAMYHAKTARQAADLAAKTRPVVPLGAEVPTGKPAAEQPALAPTGKAAKLPVPTPTPAPTPTKPPVRRSGLFGL